MCLESKCFHITLKLFCEPTTDSLSLGSGAYPTLDPLTLFLVRLSYEDRPASILHPFSGDSVTVSCDVKNVFVRDLRVRDHIAKALQVRCVILVR